MIDGQLDCAPADGTQTLVMPASFAQELIWTIDRAAPDASVYNVARTRRLGGPLDVVALRGAIDALVARHEILRTSYDVVDGRTVQVVWPANRAALSLVDLSDHPPAARFAEAERIVGERSRSAFDLALEVPLRVALIRIDANDHVLHVDTHHIACDGWSQDIFFRELGELYAAGCAGRAASLAPLPIQYADYAIWQREQIEGARLERLLAYWRSEFEGVEVGDELPADFPRSAWPSDAAFAQNIVLESGLIERLKSVGRRYGATLYMTLLAVFQVLLHRCSGQPDVVVGFPVAGRERPETEGLIGCFVNMLALRARFGADPTFGEHLRDVRERMLGASDHADLPFERLALELHAAHPDASSTLVRSVFTMIDLDEHAAHRFGDIDVQPFRANAAVTKFDLELFMRERADGVVLVLRARRALWLPATIERFLARLRSLIEAVAAGSEARVSELELLPLPERAQLAAWNATDRELGVPSTIGELLDATVARVPERTALVVDGERISYREFGRRVDELAARLRGAGVGRGARVGVLLERPAAAVVAVFAILKTGAAYVPLSLPAARLELQVAQSETAYVIGTAVDAPLVSPGVVFIDADCRDTGERAAGAASRSGIRVSPDAPAYILFTSGSTGVPKGVAATHSNVVHYARAISRVLADIDPAAGGDGLAALDGWHFALVGTLAADLGYTALFPAFFAGGTLHLPSTQTVTDVADFAAFMAAASIDVLKITPSHLRALVPDGERAASRLPNRWLILGGEPLPFELADDVLSAGRCRILNHYGPTETTVGACTFTVTAESLAAARAAGAQTVPIGRPLANVRCAVRDPHGGLAPIGVPGELIIAGAGVTLGYYGRAELTRERFFTETTGGRAYRSGDRARTLASGAIEYLGRLDDQVKVRGHRVEPGEIEARLAAHPLVKVAAVRAWGNGGDAVLAAYVVPRNGHRVSAQDVCARLRAHLIECLPQHMQPGSLELIEALPLSANGKLDRRRLPRPAAVAGAVRVPPRTPIEVEVVALFAAVFGRPADAIGVNDDFVSLGGHSLLAMRLIGEIGRRFGVRFALRGLFDTPTVAKIAERIDLEVQLAALEDMTDEEAQRALASDARATGPDA